MTLSAPAKINLSLRITGKRDDGFHELETLVLPIESLADELTFTESDQFSLHCNTPGVPTDESNLISRSLRLFEKESGLRLPLRDPSYQTHPARSRTRRRQLRCRAHLSRSQRTHQSGHPPRYPRRMGWSTRLRHSPLPPPSSLLVSWTRRDY